MDMLIKIINNKEKIRCNANKIPIIDTFWMALGKFVSGNIPVVTKKTSSVYVSQSQCFPLGFKTAKKHHLILFLKGTNLKHEDLRSW